MAGRAYGGGVLFTTRQTEIKDRKEGARTRYPHKNPPPVTYFF
jgi:hypothetical protein